MSIFIRPYESNNVFRFYEDIDTPNLIKTISYQLDTDGTIKSQWVKTSNLRETATRIIYEVAGINRVTYDITSKPSGTIEWE